MSTSNAPALPSGIKEMLELSKLISSAVAEIVDGYTGQTMPSLYSVDSGPFDYPEDTPLKISKAIRTIEAACAQLSITVASPGHVVLNKCYGFQEPTCILVASDAKIADHLLDKPEGVHVDELSKKTGVDADKLGRVLRLLVTKHVFAEVKPNVFANNRLSMKLRSSDPMSDFIGHVVDEGMKGCAMLNDNLKDPETTGSELPSGSAFVRAHGCNLFEYLSSPEQQERSERFGRAMLGWGSVTGKAMLPKVYPWASLPKDTTICDVAGGNGHATAILLKSFPQLKVVVQDLPGVVEQGKEFIVTEISDQDLRERIEYVPLDFFNGAPVKDCDFYYLRHVLHDWPNPTCQTILKSVRSAMKPSSRLLIHELVLQHVVRDSKYEQIFDVAPEPLLPNYGVGNVRPYAQDITMMFMLNSRERTLQNFIDMTAQVGLKFVKLWDQGEVGLLEFELQAE